MLGGTFGGGEEDPFDCASIVLSELVPKLGVHVSLLLPCLHHLYGCLKRDVIFC